MTVGEFTGRIYVLGVTFGFSVTSWGRTVARNVAVGGHPESYHKRWLAVDAVLDDPSDVAGLRRVSALLGLEVIDEGDHVHIEPAGPRETRPA